MFYFTSDAHFGDSNTIVNDNRPFKSVKQCDNYLIKTWNKQATKLDTIYFVGDFADCDGETSISWQTTIKYVKRIKAQVILVVGNNEERIIKYFFDNSFEKFREYCLQLGFKDVVKNCELEFAGHKFYLTHKPKNYKTGILNLFGHSHRSCGLYMPFGFNIGCDLNHFRLYSESDILHLIYMKETYWDKDQNLHLNLNK